MKRYIPEICSTTKTYATEANAVAAVEKKFGNWEGMEKQTYIIMQATNGRWVPVFIGERSMARGLHFHCHIIA